MVKCRTHKRYSNAYRAMNTSYSLDIGATGAKPLKHTTNPSQYLLRGERLQHSWPCWGYRGVTNQTPAVGSWY